MGEDKKEKSEKNISVQDDEGSRVDDFDDIY